MIVQYNKMSFYYQRIHCSLFDLKNNPFLVYVYEGMQNAYATPLIKYAPCEFSFYTRKFTHLAYIKRPPFSSHIPAYQKDYQI